MARNDYTGVPDVEPQLGAANDYEHIETSPGNFGGQVGQATEQAGADLFKLQGFYDETAANESLNNYLQSAQSIMNGQPGKTVPGPDGQPGPDMGFLGLRGANAMSALQPASEALDEAATEQRSGLKTLVAQKQFDADSRRYRAQFLNEMSTHAREQQFTWMADTNATAGTVALNGVGAQPLNDATVADATERVRQAYVRNAQLKGEDPAGAILKADQDVALARIRSLVGSDNPNDRAAAQTILDQSSHILASLPNYDGIVRQVKGAVVEATLDPTVDNLVSGALSGAHGAGIAGPLPSPSADAQLDAPDRTRGQSTVQFYQSKGWSAAAGAGIAANLYAESGISPNPSGSNDGGAAYGAFQAHDAYQRSFQEHMGKPIQGSSLQDQEEFLHWDLTQGPDKAVGDQLKNAQTPEEAARIFMTGIERPKDQSPQAIADRSAVARQIAGGTFAPAPGAPQGAAQSGGMSVADRLENDKPTLIANARTALEAKFPNQPDIVDRGVEKFERQLNVQITQQDQQYLVDTHVVQSAMDQAKPTSEQDLIALSPQVAQAWQANADREPACRSRRAACSDANARGLATQFGTQFKGYLDRVLAPDGDPTRIKDPSGLVASASGTGR